MRRPALALALAVPLLLAMRCEDETRPGPTGLASFRVRVLADRGTPEEPVPVPRGVSRFRIRAIAVGYDGRPLTTYRGTARVKVTPGRTVPAAFPLAFDDETPDDGIAETSVDVLGVHSTTQVWVIDDDPSKTDPPTYASGVGGPVWFDQPTLADVNQIPPNGDNTGSAYPGDFVEMTRRGEPGEPGTRRDLLVTAIFNDGFYVTDLAEAADPLRPGNFASLFVFNFSYPEDLLVGDRLEHLQGTLLDFSGNTQLAFPTWVRDEGGPYLADLEALERAAPALDADTCGATSFASRELCGYSSSNFDLESLESAIVRVPRVRLPDLWARCDLDGDGDIAPFRQEGSAFVCNEGDEECLCNVACLTSKSWSVPGWEDRAFDATGRICSELGGYHTFGQYAVRILGTEGNEPRVNLTSRDAVPDFDPLAEGSLGAELSVRGVLRHVRAARPRWLVNTRGPEDLCCLSAERCPAGLTPCG